jgi:hypothetical protein
MGWEYRGNRLYYYRKKREGKHVVSEYIGAGISGYLIAVLDDEERLERTYNQNQWKKQRNEMKKIENDLNQLQKNINGFVRAVFLTSGYHPHKGQWRRTRNG